MQRLIVDMDGVLADVYSQFRKYEKEESGINQEPHAIIGKKEGEAYKNVRIYVNTPGFFLEAPVIPGSIEVMEQLNREYELFIVSSAMEFPLSLYEKYQWLQQHFPFLSWQQLVLCGSKKVVSGDIMLDDHFKNLDHFNGKTILFTQPHNQLADPGRHERVNNWKEVAELLLPQW
ncbi:5'(3')-deoxyribonucleotidase [Niabella ginsenosidivorans]|uniref:5'(3')-deoxyribonucleotidase n=1 Tax=Niabella ginsenosidivorans TaxID=1176587 RepID=A0A1A9HXJ2_9BACT|nr:5'(3')-deoxyribonucleotidase [Niabella ginsenosidivorans]ANH80138.1 5'(3')-deoxyribonucleotidase [Niabella ginsenosidivorans]